MTLPELIESLPSERKRRVERRKEYYALLEKIRYTRKKLGMTTQMLSDYSGVPREAISKIENGHRNVTLKTLMKITCALGLKIEILEINNENR